MRYRGEDVEALVAWGSEGGIGAGWSVKIEREVLRQNLVFEDIVEQAFVAGSEPDGVVGEIGVGAVGAEIDQK